MILYFMKQDALQFMKTNIDVLYPKYYSEETCDWISEAYGQDAFEVFKEVPDFELCSLESGSSGEVDFENIQIIYKALINISESQASDERLWAGLCNKVFYQYIRKRWKYDEKDIVDAEKDVAGIISRFYFTGPSRGHYFRNTISKCWWVGRLTYDEKRPEDPFYYLKAIGSSDLNSKITEIFYNSTFTSNPMILKGLFEALSLYYERSITLLVKEVLRPSLSYLNAIGGGILLDALETEDITKMLVEKINGVLMGRGSVFISDVYEDEEDNEEPDLQDTEIESKQFQSTQLTQSELPETNNESEDAKDIFIEKGDTVKLWIKEQNKMHSRDIPASNDTNNWYTIDRLLLGKRIGDSVYVKGNHYSVKEILRK